MTYSLEKQILEEKHGTTLIQLKTLLANSPSIHYLEQLRSDVQNDYYTIVVVGEFKHGKSTFVNALLNESLMPVDVVPTTATINAIFYGEQRELHIVKKNGEIEKKELSHETLSEYTADADFNPDEVNYLKIFLPSSLLKNRVVLVDTPGVNDLNEHRSNITHQFIPRADAVLFMIDMQAPVKKTEVDFLNRIIKKESIKRLFFAANFLDRIDEDEIDDITEFVESRIQSITGEEHPKVFPISALDGLNAKLTNDEDLLEWSGIKPLEKAIHHLLENGSRANDKLERYHARTSQLYLNIQTEIEMASQFSMQDINQLESQLNGIEQWFNEKDQWYSQVNQYIDDRQDEIKLIVRKSLYYFGERLKKDISNRIEFFQGNDMKPFIEKQLPFTIKSQIEQWIEQYSESIQELFLKLEVEISKGLTESFQQTVDVQNNIHSSLQLEPGITNMEAKTGHSSIKAGLVVGGASTVALLLGASIFVPVLAMAGIPFLQSKIAQKQIESIKPALLITMDEQLSETIKNLEIQLNQYIASNVDRIRQNTIFQFEQQVDYMKITIDEQIYEKQKETSNLQQKMNQLQQFSDQLKESIEEMNGK